MDAKENDKDYNIYDRMYVSFKIKVRYKQDVN